MTAKHRKGKGAHKHEDDGLFKSDAAQSEVGAGLNSCALLLALFLLIVIGGATGAWFCFQQHQTLTYLTDNLMGMQMKIVKLQSSHEAMRQSSSEVRHKTNKEVFSCDAIKKSHYNRRVRLLSYISSPSILPF